MRSRRGSALPSGTCRSTEVTPERVETWWVERQQEVLSRKHLRNLRTILRGICRRAVTLRLLGINPVDRIEGRIGKEHGEVKKRSDYLVTDNLTTFLTTAERVCPKEYAVLLVMATTGLRVGEAVGLQIGDLDSAGLRMTIRRRVRRSYIDSPKNGKAEIVAVLPTTMAVLQQIKEIRRAEAAVNGTEARWLFPIQFRKDMPITPEAIGQAMTKVLKAAGLRKIRPHDLRHTYATLAIQAGVNIVNVSRQLRHWNIAITTDIYAHAVPGGNRAAVDVKEAILARNQAQPTPQPRRLTPRFGTTFVKQKPPSRVCPLEPAEREDHGFQDQAFRLARRLERKVRIVNRP
jgi:integrase